MAKVKFGSGVADIRGSIGGTVFSRNSSGAYMREKVSPVNPNTPRQSVIRGRLTLLSKNWQTLSKGLRTAWKNFANEHPITNAFGAQVTLSGALMYNRVNSVILNLGGIIINTPPPNFEVPEFELVQIQTVGADPEFGVDFEAVPAVPGLHMQASIAGPHSPGKEFVKNLLRFIGSADVSAGGQNANITLPARFNNFVQGSTYTASISFASSVNGAVSTPVIQQFIPIAP